MVIVAGAAVVVAASVIAAGLGAGARWIFEVLAATGVLVGLAVAFGVVDRGPSRRRRAGRGAAPLPTVTPELTAALQRRLGALDPVEHRRLDLGTPWPAVIVGPTGVSVVTGARRVTDPVVARLEQVVAQVRGVAATLGDGRPVAVRGLLVVPDAEAATSASADVRTVIAGEVWGAIARGPLVPMSTVTDLFARLSGELEPDLRLDDAS